MTNAFDHLYRHQFVVHPRYDPIVLEQNGDPVFESLLADNDLTHPPEKMAPEAARVLEALLADPTELSRAHRVFEESSSKILSTLLQERLDAVDHLLQNTLDEQQETQLLVEKARLAKERRELGRDWSPTVRRAMKGNHL